MSITRTVAEVLRKHVTLQVEGIDRMYLNVYVPTLQRAGGVASFFRFHRGYPFASCPLLHLETPPSGPPLIVSSLRLTAAVRTKNSSPENLTHLHYNLLGKDASLLRRPRRAASVRRSGIPPTRPASGRWPA
jgi:hypothetical protein